MRGAGAAVLLAAALLLPRGARADDIRVTKRLEPAEATVGDRLVLSVEFAAPPNVRIEPVLSTTRYADWDVAGLGTERGPDGARFRFLLVPWSATLTGTPSLAFNARFPSGETRAIKVPPEPVAMASVLAEAEDPSRLKPLKGVIGYRSWWPWVIGLAAVALAAAGWWWWRRERRRALPPLPPKPAEPPEVVARRDLAALLASALLEEGRTKDFYFRLTEIFRTYVESRFSIPALDRTTSELLPELRRHEELRGSYPDLRRFLEAGDLVKFAKHVPSSADVEADVARLKEFVDRTSSTATEARA